MRNGWVKNIPPPQWIQHFLQTFGEITRQDYKFSHITKIGPNIFRMTSLFCLRQHFSAITQLIFIENLGNNNRLLSQNLSLLVVWKLLSSSFKMSKKNYGVITIHFLLTQACFLFLMTIQKPLILLFDCHNLLKNNPINTSK